MPALQPPSMQIGALPPGAGPTAPTGPALAQAYQYTPPKTVQAVGNFSTGAAQPTTFSVTIAGTTAGNMLVAFIGGMAQGGAQNQPTPTGFSTLAGTSGAIAGTTIAGAWAFLPNCGAGITTVSWPTLTNFSSCCAIVWELSGISTAPVFLASGAAANANAQNLANFSVVPIATNMIGLGVSICTSANTPQSGGTPFNIPFESWGGSGVGTLTSTNSQGGVQNTSMAGFNIRSGAITQSTAYGWTGVSNVSGALVSLGILLASLASQQNILSPGAALVVDSGGGAYGVGETGRAGFALGGTKPGGAGGGQ